MGTGEIDLVEATITEMSKRLRQGEVSPVDLTRATLERIEKVNPKLDCFVTVASEYAMRRAQLAEDEIRQGKYRGPLHGIPYTLKDNLDTVGVPTTHANPQGLDLKPRVNSTVHALLEGAGGILVGKVRMDTITFQAQETLRPLGCFNPWDVTVTPGTSSSGPGSATAASLGLGSVGTDSGGSVRHPAANCGLVGMRATLGRISRYPLDCYPASGIQSQAGPMTKTVEDNAIMFQALGVYDPQYPISINEPPYDYPAGLRDGVKGIRIGLPTDEWIWEKWVTEENEDRVRSAVALLESMGAHVLPVSLPLAEESRDLSESLGETESWYEDHMHLYENADKWDELQAAIQANRTRQVDIKSYVVKARKRQMVKQELIAALTEVDVIAMPTGMTLGDKITEDSTIIRGREVPTRSRGTRLNSLASITGFPALSVPCGFAMGDRLPVGLQLTGRPVEEPLLYRVAYAYEQATEWHLRHPPI